MWKVIIAVVGTLAAYLLGAVLELEQHINAPGLGIALAVTVMGGFIIYFNEKKK